MEDGVVEVRPEREVVGDGLRVPEGGREEETGERVAVRRDVEAVEGRVRPQE